MERAFDSIKSGYALARIARNRVCKTREPRERSRAGPLKSPMRSPETYAQLDAVQPAGHMGEISDLVAGRARLNASSRAYFALNWRRFIVNYTAAIL